MTTHLDLLLGELADIADQAHGPIAELLALDDLRKRVQEERDAALLEVYTTHTQRELADLLGVTQQSVSQQLGVAAARRARSRRHTTAERKEPAPSNT
jgi:hypothetical protein